MTYYNVYTEAVQAEVMCFVSQSSGLLTVGASDLIDEVTYLAQLEKKSVGLCFKQHPYCSAAQLL